MMRASRRGWYSMQGGGLYRIGRRRQFRLDCGGPMSTSPQDKLKQQLLDLAMNLWWSWNPATIKLCRDLDPQAFRGSKHNALVVVKGMNGDRLADLVHDAAMRARIDRAHRELRAYLSSTASTWASTHAAPLRVRPVAYLSA